LAYYFDRRHPFTAFAFSGVDLHTHDPLIAHLHERVRSQPYQNCISSLRGAGRAPMKHRELHISYLASSYCERHAYIPKGRGINYAVNYQASRRASGLDVAARWGSDHLMRKINTIGILNGTKESSQSGVQVKWTKLRFESRSILCTFLIPAKYDQLASFPLTASQGSRVLTYAYASRPFQSTSSATEILFHRLRT
jgi:hypothetical protein